MDLDFVKLLHLTALAEAKSFSRAANRLGITQPALSKSIAGIEARLGFPLFERGSREIALTPPGSVVIREALALLDRVRDFNHNIRAYRDGHAGAIRIGAAPMFSQFGLPALMVQILHERPALSLKLDVRSRDATLKALIDDDIDVAFLTSFDLTSADLEIHDLFDLDVSVLARPDHPVFGAARPSIDDVWRYTIACDTGIPLPREDARQFFCNDFHILRHMALQTDALWMASATTARADLAAGRLKRVVDLAAFGITGRALLAHRKGRVLSPAERYLVEAAPAYFTAEPG